MYSITVRWKTSGLVLKYLNEAGLVNFRKLNHRPTPLKPSYSDHAAQTVLAVILFGQIRDMRNDTASVVNQIIAEQSPRIDAITNLPQSIDQRLAQADTSELKVIRAELAAIRTSVPDLSAMDEATVRSIARLLLTQVKELLPNE